MFRRGGRQTPLSLFVLFAYAVFGIWLIVAVVHAVSPALFPDEVAYLYTVRDGPQCKSLLCPAENFYGYGSLWWEICRLVVRTLGRALPPYDKLTSPLPFAGPFWPIAALRLFSVAALAGAVGFAASLDYS